MNKKEKVKQLLGIGEKTDKEDLDQHKKEIIEEIEDE